MKHVYIKLRRNEGGNIMPIFIICLTAILALIGASLSLNMDSRAALQLQRTTDEAALSGATAFIASNKLKVEDRLQDAKDQALRAAEQNAAYKLSDFDVLAASDDAFKQSIKMAVEVEFQSVNAAAGLTGRNANIDMRRRAVAEAVRGFPLCILTLGETGRGVRLLTSGQLTAENCIIWSNSKDRESISLINGKLVARGICTAGRVKGENRASPKPETGCTQIPDPLAGFSVAVPQTCDHTRFKFRRKRSYTLKPGVYCGGIDAWDMKDVSFEPGIYVIRDGPLRLNAKSPIEIDGVTFLLDGKLSGIAINGDGGVKMRAPVKGETAGIAIAQIVPRTEDIKRAYIQGKLDLQGLLYLPSYHMTIRQGGGGRTKSPYIQMVVDRINLYGNVELNIDFDPTKTELPIVIQPERTARLIE